MSLHLQLGLDDLPISCFRLNILAHQHFGGCWFPWFPSICNLCPDLTQNWLLLHLVTVILVVFQLIFFWLGLTISSVNILWWKQQWVFHQRWSYLSRIVSHWRRSVIGYPKKSSWGASGQFWSLLPEAWSLEHCWRWSPMHSLCLIDAFQLVGQLLILLLFQPCLHIGALLRRCVSFFHLLSIFQWAILDLPELVPRLLHQGRLSSTWLFEVFINSLLHIVRELEVTSIQFVIEAIGVSFPLRLALLIPCLLIQSQVLVQNVFKVLERKALVDFSPHRRFLLLLFLFDNDDVGRWLLSWRKLLLAGLISLILLISIRVLDAAGRFDIDFNVSR